MIIHSFDVIIEARKTYNYYKKFKIQKDYAVSIRHRTHKLHFGYVPLKEAIEIRDKILTAKLSFTIQEDKEYYRVFCTASLDNKSYLVHSEMLNLETATLLRDELQA